MHVESQVAVPYDEAGWGRAVNYSVKVLGYTTSERKSKFFPAAQAEHTARPSGTFCSHTELGSEYLPAFAF